MEINLEGRNLETLQKISEKTGKPMSLLLEFCLTKYLPRLEFYANRYVIRKRAPKGSGFVSGTPEQAENRLLQVHRRATKADMVVDGEDDERYLLSMDVNIEKFEKERKQPKKVDKRQMSLPGVE